MYIYLYTGPQLRLRKARSQRRPLQLTSLAKPWGEFEGGWHPDSESTRPPPRSQNVFFPIIFLTVFLIVFLMHLGAIWDPFWYPFGVNFQ